MDNIPDFAERYKKISNAELLEILDYPSQYQPVALQAAQLEFDSRQLSQTAIEEARSVLQEKAKKDERAEMVKEKFITAGNTLYDTINPIQTTTASAEKLIRLVSIIFFCYGMYELIKDAKVIAELLTGNSASLFGYTLIVFPVIFMVGGSILFWLRKQYGWIMLCFFSNFYLVLCAYMFYDAITLFFNKNKYWFFRPSPASDIVAALFYSAIVYVMCRQDIRDIFGIDKQKMKATVITGLLLGVFFVFVMSFPFIF